MQPSQSRSSRAELISGAPTDNPEVSVIVPARNEELSLRACLESLVSQQGLAFETIVVDDGSIDRTRQIAESVEGVRVTEAGPLPAGWSGKSNAAMAGGRIARGKWLLFTDADTVHFPGSLQRALAEATEHGASLLSYSPRQDLHGIVQRLVMPLIFAELAYAYRPSDICDPNNPAAAANGQYLLISRSAYDAAGGHAAIAQSLLEDVELARAVKARGGKLHFRYGGDRVRTRMYRNFAQLREGWTKNLVLLFPAPVRLAVARLAEFIATIGGATLASFDWYSGARTFALVTAGIALGAYIKVLLRVRKAHAGAVSTLLSPFGLPLFSYLLLRSRLYYKWNRVTWKGRRYATAMPSREANGADASSHGACTVTGE